jgi:signal peptidase I
MIKRLLFLLFLGVVCTLLLRTFVIEGIYVASASMEPTLPVGTNLFLEKVTLQLGSPKRGDVVVFPSPVKDRHDLIKRVIALPGEQVQIKDKLVYIDQRPLAELYVQHTRSAETLEDDNLGPLTVPRGSLFVMGDNRDVSGDSRDWKDPLTGEHVYFVPVSSVKGTIVQLF